MAAVVCLDFLPLYFQVDTEVSIGSGINELHRVVPYVFRRLLTSAPSQSSKSAATLAALRLALLH